MGLVGGVKDTREEEKERKEKMPASAPAWDEVYQIVIRVYYVFTLVSLIQFRVT